MSIEITFPGNKKVDALFDGYTVHTDQPVRDGGDGSSPAPFSLFLASLGTCAGIYVKDFCDHRGIDTKGISLTLDYHYDQVQKMIAKFIIRIHVPADFPEQYDSAVIRSAALCAVKRHLNPAIGNEITVVRTQANQ
ncbi:MAG: OsmC family protein [Bacteroidales bacterium]|jgi:ribosomal protein S12 methylthiotransferase accessory factor|nr:OsmC family protein [Bacteroidales bacterium]